MATWAPRRNQGDWTVHREAGNEGPQRSTARAAVALVGTLVVGVALAGCSGDAPASPVPSSAFGTSGARSPSAPADAGCPTLEDYALASLQPSAEPAPPSFDPVAPAATPSSGLLPLGATGILAAPDGSPGALIRVSNARFCERLPDVRPDLYPGGTSTRLLLADVEIEVLESGTIYGLHPDERSRGRRPTTAEAVISAVHAWAACPAPTTGRALEPRAGFTYRGHDGLGDSRRRRSGHGRRPAARRRGRWPHG